MKNINEIPFYMLRTKFAVPERLEQLIEGMSINERKKYAHIYCTIRSFSKDKFTDINRKVFKNICGENYTQYLKNLKEWKIIECDDNRYWFDKNNYKNYGWKIVEQKNLKKYEIEMVRKPKKQRVEILTDVQEHVEKCLNQLVVADDVVEDEDPDICYSQYQYWQKVKCKEWNCHYGNGDQNNRLFHTVIEMPKYVRKDIRHKERKILVDCDLTACHTIFLLNWCPEEEKEIFKKLLGEDIYEILAKDRAITRKEMKTHFLYWANGQYASEFSKALSVYCPGLVKAYEKAKKGKNMASILQRIEADIILIQFGKWCADNRKFFIACHDGFIAKKTESEELIARLKEIIKEEFDFEPKIKSVDLREIAK